MPSKWLALLLLAGFVAEQLEIVVLEDRQIVRRAERMMAARRKVESERLIRRSRLIEFAVHQHDDMIELGRQSAALVSTL